MADPQIARVAPIDGTDLRHEIKLVVDAGLVNEARTWIRMHPAGFRVAYPPRAVNSLYLDTPDLAGVNANLVGISRRSKLRLRWYGSALETIVRPTLELKYKSNLLGGKRRQALDCTLDTARTWSELLELVRGAADAVWGPWLDSATQPALLNQYWREYYVTPDGVMRVTLDFDQVAYDQRMSARPNVKARLRLPALAVIELKAPRTALRRLQDAVAFFPVRRYRNSKYVIGVLAALS